MSFAMGLCVRCDFGQPVCGHSGLCSCVAIEFAWYVLFCSFLASWLLGGGWFWCRYGGFWMVSYYLMFCVVRSFLVFSGFGLMSPAFGFPFYSSNSLKTSPTMQP